MINLHTGLPVEQVLPELTAALARHRSAVLCAPPGAGKSTLAPPALLDAGFLHGQKILMLEPRRIAAAGAARWIARLLGEPVGQRAGYRTRFGSAVSAATRIEVITEGILTRMIQDDPELAGTGVVIFDEFHERSLQADLGLALALDVQHTLRDDLRILVMSATLDAARVQILLGDDTPLIKSGGKAYEVETLYRPAADRTRPLEKTVAAAVADALNRREGDILVFLPGGGEIRRTLAELERLFPDAAAQKLVFLPLSGELPQEAQERALAPAEPPWRKVIVSTPVAESSVTVPGVRIVIDSGWMRTPRFSPATAMDALATVRVSRASADQRRGRAARTGPGLCIRLWDKKEELAFAPFNTPEILAADLATPALELANWGLTPATAGTLRWLDPPPQAKLDQAFKLLRRLGALEPDSCRLTAHGKVLLKRPMHPRLAHLISCAETLHVPALGCALAGILAERDFLRNGSGSDLNERLKRLLPGGDASGDAVDRGTLHRVRTVFRQLAGGKNFTADDCAYAGVLCGKAYPDRIAKARAPHSGEYTLANGGVARLRREDVMRKYDFLAVPAVEGTNAGPVIFLAAELTREEIEEHFAELTTSEATVRWDDAAAALQVRREKRLGSLTLDRKPLPADTLELPHEQRLRAFLNGIRKHPLPWSEHEQSCLERLEFLRRTLGGDWPDVSAETLSATLEEWLAPFLTARHTSLASLRGATLAAAFRALAGRDKLARLEQLAPERFETPSGSRIKIDYSHDPPLLPVRLQEVFGMTATPLLAGGHVPLAMNLLSPAMRTLQITSDLAHFWANSYVAVRKEMRGRYPKHDWPEDPLHAPPHRGRVRRRLPPRNDADVNGRTEKTAEGY